MLNQITIGEKIAEGRKELGLSQAQLAELLSVSPQAVSKWERGESMPDVITLSRIATVFHKDLNYFAGEVSKSTAEDIGVEAEEKNTRESKGTGRRPTWDMSMGEWKDADFSGIQNSNGRFNFSNIKNCNFVAAGMAATKLRANNVARCDFSEADLSGCSFSACNLKQNTFGGASLAGTTFTASNISENDFSGANLTGTEFKGCLFGGNTIAGVALKNTVFKNMRLKDIVFDSAITDCSFSACDCNRVEFKGVTFTNTFFKHGNFKKAVFTDCFADRISYSFLKSAGCDMDGITLM